MAIGRLFVLLRHVRWCPRTLWLFVFFRMFGVVGHVICSMTLAAHLVVDRSFSTVQAVSVCGVQFAVCGAMSLPAYRLAALVRPRTVLIIGSICGIIGHVIVGLVKEHDSIAGFVLITLCPISYGIVVPLASTTIEKFAPPELRSFVHSTIFVLAHTLGGAVGLLLDSVRYTVVDASIDFPEQSSFSPFRMVFLAAAVLFSFQLIGAIFLPKYKLVGESRDMKQPTKVVQQAATLVSHSSGLTLTSFEASLMAMRFISFHIFVTLPIWSVRVWNNDFSWGAIQGGIPLLTVIFSTILGFTSATTHGRFSHQIDLLIVGVVVSCSGIASLALAAETKWKTVASVAFLVLYCLGESLWGPRSHFISIQVVSAPNALAGATVSNLFQVISPIIAAVLSALLLSTFAEENHALVDPGFVWYIIAGMGLTTAICVLFIKTPLRKQRRKQYRNAMRKRAEAARTKAKNLEIDNNNNNNSSDSLRQRPSLTDPRDPIAEAVAVPATTTSPTTTAAKNNNNNYPPGFDVNQHRATVTEVLDEISSTTFSGMSADSSEFVVDGGGRWDSDLDSLMSGASVDD